MKVALAQWDMVVGDVSGNTTRIIEAIERADGAGAQVVVLPELAVTGYPPEDLLLRRSFVDANVEATSKIAAQTGDLVAIFGFVHPVGGVLHNAAAVCQSGEIKAIYSKHLLPNYGVFDEDRYFVAGADHHLFVAAEATFGVCVCEDAWFPDGPIATQGDAGAQVVFNINASPFHKGKVVEREQMLAERARRAESSIVYLNTVGGQDELVFDGASLVLDAQGEVVARLPHFEEAFEVVDVPLGLASVNGSSQQVAGSVNRTAIELRSAELSGTSVIAEPLSGAGEVYAALVLALRDYARKNGFTKMVLGLSGGIDSTLVATIGADALGAENVLGLLMPSDFSSSHSVTDSEELARNLGIKTHTIAIAGAYESYLDMLEGAFGDVEMGIAEENIQARIRGNLNMAVSNRYGHLVVATGNKSEMAVGYATLYGDMAGGFALLKDVFKTEVYALCRYRNTVSDVIPGGVLTKPPSAELRPGQKDQDSLPPYDILDGILDLYVEEDRSRREIIAAGYEESVVDQVIRLVDRAEYKRRQAPPGPKVTTKAFGRDRRLPITNRWREA